MNKTKENFQLFRIHSYVNSNIKNKARNEYPRLAIKINEKD